MAKQNNKQKKETELIQFGDKQFVETFNKYEAKQRELVKENPFIKVVDNETWEIGKQRRTALRTGRTTLENESKEVVRKINSFKDWVKKKYSGFVEISVDAENKQQESVKAFEAIKEAEKAREAELEQQRLDGIRELIDQCEGSLDAIILKLTHDNIDESQQQFDATVDSAEYDDEQLMELKFLFNEMVERQQEKFDKQAEQVVADEQKRIDELKIQQQALINEKYVQANQAIDVMVFDTIAQTTKKVNEIFHTDFDFGEFKEKFESVANQMFTKLERTIETMKKDREQLAIQEREQEMNRQRNRIVEIREGLLDLVFQMTLENHDEQTGVIKSKMEQPKDLNAELVPDWEKMVSQVKTSFNQKMEMINFQVEKHGFKVDQREKELIGIGFEKNESGLTLDDDPDWTVADDTLWNMSDDEFETFKSDVNEMLEQNKVNNQRWDSRKPELEKLGLVEIDNEDGGEFIFEQDPQIGIHSGMVIGLDDEDFAERRDQIKSEIQEWKDNDAKEQERQEKIKHDKSNLVEWINHGVRRNKANVADLTDNQEMKDFHHQMIDELNAWCDAKIEQIKKF